MIFFLKATEHFFLANKSLGGNPLYAKHQSGGALEVKCVSR